VIILGEDHLRGVLKEYVSYFNISRPRQGIQQSIPGEADRERPLNTTAEGVHSALKVAHRERLVSESDFSLINPCSNADGCLLPNAGKTVDLAPKTGHI
jgi:hypothetical protein